LQPFNPVGVGRRPKQKAPTMSSELTLISHTLCPYVQRAAIALTEKGVPFRRVYVDLGKKPAWFLELSPLGKTPVLTVAGEPIFESAAILEYLEDTQPRPLHPKDPLTRAQHRGWIEFGSTILNDIAGLYSAGDVDTFRARVETLIARFALLESRLGDGPYFGGRTFTLVDAVFGPVFRYFDIFDEVADLGILSPHPRVGRWRSMLAARPSVRDAVTNDYPAALREFLLRRGGYLSSLMTGHRCTTSSAA
jgi:glutathione S-transferase